MHILDILDTGVIVANQGRTMVVWNRDIRFTVWEWVEADAAKYGQGWFRQTNSFHMFMPNHGVKPTQLEAYVTANAWLNEHLRG